MKVVIDTNVLLVCISPRSDAHWLWQALLTAGFDLFVWFLRIAICVLLKSIPILELSW